MKRPHKCAQICSDMLSSKFYSKFLKLADLSNEFNNYDRKLLSLLNKLYDEIEMHYPFAIQTKEFSHYLLKAPLSMQGDYAKIIRVDGSESHISPLFGCHFTMYEFQKVIDFPVRYFITGNIAIYYSTRKGLLFNKEASQSFNKDLFGDVIVLPSTLAP